MRRIILILSMLFVSSPLWGDQLSPYEEELIRKVKNVFPVEKVPYPEKISHPICATPVFVEINANRKNLSLEAQKILNIYTSRPQLEQEKTLNTPKGHFKIHYTTVGVDSVYQAHTDNDHNGVPDYVDNCAQILDYVWAKEIDTLGYDDTSLNDGFYPSGKGNGGDGRYDVYLISMSLVFFGYTVSDSPLVGSSYQYTSYIVLRNDYSMYKYLYAELYDPLKVTCAHEFFHAIHFGYDATEYEFSGDKYKPYWMEISATWMEDQLYDEINDYLYYIPYFYYSPWISLKSFKNEYDRHPYGSCVWAFFLQERFKDTGIIKKIWERCAQIPGDNVIDAIDEVLMDTAYKSSLEDAFREFTFWNWFIGDRAMPDKFYSEGDLFKDTLGFPMQVKVSATFSSYPIDSSSIYPPQVLGSNYIRFIPYDSSGGIKVFFDGDKYTHWKASLLGYSNGFRPTEIEFQLDSLQDGQAQIDNWTNYSEIILIPTVASKEKTIYTYPYDYRAFYDSSLHGIIPYRPWVRVIGNPPFIVYVGNTLSFSVIATDQNLEDTLTLTKYGKGEFAPIQGVSPLMGSFSWTPSFDDTLNSPYEDTFIVVDKSGLADTTFAQIYVKSIPKKDVAEQNFPNPFVVASHQYTYFPIILSQNSDVEVSIFTLSGELVKKLATKRLNSGYNYDKKDLPYWDGKNEDGDYVSSGVYLYYFKTNTTTQLKKMVVIR